MSFFRIPIPCGMTSWSIIFLLLKIDWNGIIGDFWQVSISSKYTVLYLLNKYCPRSLGSLARIINLYFTYMIYAFMLIYDGNVKWFKFMHIASQSLVAIYFDGTIESVLKVVLDLDGIVVEFPTCSPPSPPPPPPPAPLCPLLVSSGTSFKDLYFLMIGPHRTEFSRKCRLLTLVLEPTGACPFSVVESTSNRKRLF